MAGERIAPTRGVPVELDRTRYLRYTMGTLRKIREEFGSEAMQAGLSDEKLAKALWYGFRGDDPGITVEQIEEMIDMENLAVVVDAMAKAMGYRAEVKVDGQGRPRPPSPAASDEGAGGSAE